MVDSEQTLCDSGLIMRLIKRGDRRSLALLELMRPLPLRLRIRNAAYQWCRPW